MKGYKVFNSDWTCRGFQYKVGGTFKYEGTIKICEAGFHFCEKIADCFNYYKFDSNNKVAKIKAIGNIETDGEKFVTDKIRIVRELSWHEVLDLVNVGKNCTGRRNSGDWNSGCYNSGNHNSGSWNSGNENSGNGNSGTHNSGSWNSGTHNSGSWNSGNYNLGCENSGGCNSGNGNSGSYNSGTYNSGNSNSGSSNSGYRNSGGHNSGAHNSGNYNSGDHNLGDYNSGNWNSCNFSTGFFNSISQTIYAFNKPLNISREEFMSCIGVQILRDNYHDNFWVYDSDMTSEEKKSHPEYKNMGGYLKAIDAKTAYKIMWDNLNDAEKQAVKEIPNFDAKVFKEITGIDVNK